MKKAAIVLLVLTVLITGCSRGPAGEPSRQSDSSNFFNAESSYFASYTKEETKDGCLIKGVVNQENDGNAVVARVRAEQAATVEVSGTMTRESGGDTRLVYVTPEGEEIKIADNSAEAFATTIDLSAGDGKLVFMGESAIYDFEVQLELTDGVSYSDL